MARACRPDALKRQATYRGRTARKSCRPLFRHTGTDGMNSARFFGHADCCKSLQPEKTSGKNQENDMREVVLYVEDHPVNVLLMQTVFELRPELDLVVAVDGMSAMAATTRVLPSLLLLDLRLPDCDGIELLERMRKVAGWEDIPAIAVTAEAEFMPAGTSFCDVWHKPLRVPTLLTRLDRVLVPRRGRGDPSEVPVKRKHVPFTRTTFAT
jgi:CheY-like chemotaxis protein